MTNTSVIIQRVVSRNNEPNEDGEIVFNFRSYKITLTIESLGSTGRAFADFERARKESDLAIRDERYEIEFLIRLLKNLPIEGGS